MGVRLDRYEMSFFYMFKLKFWVYKFLLELDSFFV